MLGWRALVLSSTLAALGCAREVGPARSPELPASPVPAGSSSGSPVGPLDTTSEPTPPVLETLHGEASYYSDRLAGRSTASGEPYLPGALTAAHRTLPFGTIVRVTRADSSRSVQVKINDRGPFGKQQRIIDLSRRAAEELDMIRAGVIRVRVEVLEYGAGRR